MLIAFRLARAAALLAAMLGPARGWAAYQKGGLLEEGPRSAAAGGAAVAMADDIIASSACPAGLARLGLPALAGAWGGSMKRTLAATTVGAGGIVEGIGLSALVRETSFSGAAERTVSLGAGIPFEDLPWLAVGAAFKVLSADYVVDRASGFAFDAGAQGKHVLPVRDAELGWAASIEDAMGGIKWEQGFEEDTQRQGRFGVGIRVPPGPVFLAEYRRLDSATDRGDILGAGIEQPLSFMGAALALRAGWRDGSGLAATATCGAGARFGPLAADYAAAQSTGVGGGMEHFVSASWGFSGITEVATAREEGPVVMIKPSKESIEVIDAYQTMDFAVSYPRGINSTGWIVMIMDHCGEIIWNMEGEGTPPLGLKWDGTTMHGAFAPPGTYSCVLLVREASAWRHASRTASFRLRREGEGAELPFKEGKGGF